MWFDWVTRVDLDVRIPTHAIVVWTVTMEIHINLKFINNKKDNLFRPIILGMNSNLNHASPLIVLVLKHWNSQVKLL